MPRGLMYDETRVFYRGGGRCSLNHAFKRLKPSSVCREVVSIRACFCLHIRVWRCPSLSATTSLHLNFADGLVFVMYRYNTNDERATRSPLLITNGFNYNPT